MAESELLAQADQNPLIIVAEVHRALAAPRCALVVRDYREVTLSVEQSG
jgi:hypothetical protein